MKTLWIKFIFAFLMSAVLSGCITAGMWKKNENNFVYSKEDSDTLMAFGENAKTGQLVIMGEKYWFVLDKKSGQEIRAIISSNLSSSFKTDKEIEIKLTKDNGFYTLFTLYYSPVNDNEKTKIEKLGFQCLPSYCQKIYNSYGTVYKAEQTNIKNKNQLKQHLPIVLLTEDKITNKISDGLEIIGKILQTPLALAADVIILPFEVFYIATMASDK